MSKAPSATSARSALIVGNFLSASGVASRGVCEDLAERLAGDGWTISTTSTRRQRLPRLIDMISTARRQRHRYEVAQVDLFSGPAFSWAQATCWTLRRLGKPYVLTLHGGALPEFARKYPQRVRRLLRSAAAVTSPSGYLIAAMRPYRDDLIELPNPIDLDLYPVRRRTTIEPRIVWVRAMHTIYAPSVAVETLAQLIELDERFSGARLSLVGPDKGDGSLEESKDRARALGVEARVEWVGAVAKSEVPSWLEANDIFLNTSRIDNAPVSVIEPMACGLPVVSTDVGGIPHLLENERTALLTPADDPQAMAHAIARVIDDAALRDRLTMNARQGAERRDWSVVLPRWQRLLTAAADGRSAAELSEVAS